MSDNRLAKYQQFVLALYELYRPLDSEVVARNGPDDVLGEALLQLFRTIRIRYQVNELLRRIIERINAGKKFPEILDFLFESLGPVIRCDRMGVGLLEGDGSRLRLQWVRSTMPPSNLTVGYTAQMQGSSLQKILESGQPRIIDDLEEYLRQNPDSKSTQLALKDGLRSSLTCPLVTNGRPVGFLFFSSTAPRTYGTTHVQHFLGIANEVSLIVDQARVWKVFG